MRYILLLFIILCCNYTHAQESLIYPTLNDYKQNNPRKLNLTSKSRSFSDNEWVGATVYDFIGASEGITASLHNACFAIDHHDSLFINLYGAMDVKGYAYVKARFGTYLYFSSVASNLIQHYYYVNTNSKGHTTNNEIKNNYLDATGVIGYAIASTIINSKKEGRYASSKQFSYLYGLVEGEVFLLTPEVLEAILQSRTDLLRLYINSGSPDNDGSYYFYLSKLFNKE